MIRSRAVPITLDSESDASIAVRFGFVTFDASLSEVANGLAAPFLYDHGGENLERTHLQV